MWGRLALSILLAAVLPRVALAQEQYFCIGEKATGFKWNGKEWSITSFKVENKKFFVQEIPPLKVGDDVYTFEVKTFGSNSVEHRCTHTKAPNFSRVVCGGLGMGMLVDTINLRFQELYGFGYIDGLDDDKNTPNLVIGKCTRVK